MQYNIKDFMKYNLNFFIIIVLSLNFCIVILKYNTMEKI